MTMGVRINDRDGKHYRIYTKDTLQMLFDVSPSAVNFELMILIESLTFFAYRVSCEMREVADEYKEFLSGKGSATFYEAIERIYNWGIIDRKLKSKLHKYREERNIIVHDLFRLKSFDAETGVAFKDFSYKEAQEKLFTYGIQIFEPIVKAVTPGLPTQEEYLKRFSGYYRRK